MQQIALLDNMVQASLQTFHGAKISHWSEVRGL
jgi:hypothetical protein